MWRLAKDRVISSGLFARIATRLAVCFCGAILCFGCSSRAATSADVHEHSKDASKSTAKDATNVDKPASEPNKQIPKKAAEKVVEKADKSPETTKAATDNVSSSGKKPEKESTHEVRKEAGLLAPLDAGKESPKKAADNTKVTSEKPAANKKDAKTPAAAVTEGSGKISVVHVRSKARPAPMLVPPPPPDTPTMMPSFGDETSGLMPMEYMSPELLKKRKLDLVAQLADAKSDLKQKQDDVDSVRQKAVQFKTLFEEGVISRRELETAQKEAGEIDSSVNRAQLRVSELQTLMDGVNGRWNQINKSANQKKSGNLAIKKLSSKAPHRTH